ncbi:H-type lectin domain-containing protein [Streptomyces sp. NPDC004838]
MATTDDYGQGVTIATLGDPPDAETLARNLANKIVERSVMRFASASARTAAITAPVEGMITDLADANRLYRYNGTAWEPVAALVQHGKALVSFTNLASYTMTVTFPKPFPSTPSVTVGIASAAGPTARWDARADTETATNFRLFVFSGDNPPMDATWANVPVTWTAVAT